MCPPALPRHWLFDRSDFFEKSVERGWATCAMSFLMNSPYSMPVGELSAEVRGSFLVRVYSQLALAILLFVGIEVWFFQSGIAQAIVGAFSSVHWLLILGGFMLLSWLATFLAQPTVSRPLQYLGLVFYVMLQAVITVPLLDLANQTAPGTIASAAQATLGGFFLLTGVVVVTRKDFSFLRTFLVWGGIFAMGVIVCAVLFKFDLGTWFSVAMVLLAGGSILHTTSAVMRDYPENADLAAAIQLFAGVALMFWYVLRLFLGSRR
jgi:FtsH-binding integral membrane protein